MLNKKINNQLPLTIQKANISKTDKTVLLPINSWVSVKSLSSNFVLVENFYKPISKIVEVNEK